MAAPIHPKIDSTSFTKPRPRASSVESAMTASTTMSTKFTESCSDILLRENSFAGAQRSYFIIQPIQHVLQVADFEHLNARDGVAFLLGIAPAGHQDAAEAELAGLALAQLRLRDHAHLAREADLAERRHVFRHRPVGEGADQRQGDREVGRRFADSKA